MEKALVVLNRLAKEGLIKEYALGGAFSLLFYTEPALTYDLDVFIFFPQEWSSAKLIDLGPIYSYLRSLGYRAEKEHILIEGVPVQLIPTYNSLVEEAVRDAKIKKYKGVSTRVLSLEHLLALMLQTGRSKDKQRIAQLIEGCKINRKHLREILVRHDLKRKWEKEVGKL